MTLWKHQEECIARLLPLRGAGCFADMGCGKSRIALELLHRWNVNLGLIACPKAVITVWERQVEKFFKDRWQVLALTNGTTDTKTKAVSAQIKRQAPTLIVVNYESVWREKLGALLMNCGLQATVADELHRAKAPGGVASRFLSRLGPRVSRRLGLTGTPLPHGPLDAYAQYRFLDPRIFGYSFVKFRARYAVLGGFQGKQVLEYVNLEELHQKMYSVAWRAEAGDVLDLPPEMDETITFALDPKTLNLYREFEKELVAYVETADQQISAANVLTKLLRLAQITGGWITTDDGRQTRIDHNKAAALTDLLDGMGKEPVVIFCRFTKDLETCLEVCKKLDLRACELSGKTNELTRFECGQAQVLVAQIKSGGVGIDLTRARYAIFYSLGYSLGDYLQAKKRIHRPGQTRPVVYYHLCAAQTVDVKIMQAIEKRQELVNYVVDLLRNQ